jgi:cupin superfamily acireductone dioxygenase involved in methionine salvage
MKRPTWWQRNICGRETPAEIHRNHFDYQMELIVSATMTAKDEADCKKVDAMIANFGFEFQDVNNIENVVDDLDEKLRQKREQVKPRHWHPRYINMYNPENLFE